MIVTAETIKNEVSGLRYITKKALWKEIERHYFSVTTDHWTSKANDNYSCLTAQLMHAVLSFVVHTGPTKGTDKYNQFVRILIQRVV
jgi:hypothetical protein